MNISNKDMLYLMKKVVLDKYKDSELKLEDGSDFELTEDGIIVLSFEKALGNFKAMINTIVNDDLYYEVTFDNETAQIHLDTYQFIKGESFNVTQNDSEQQEEKQEEVKEEEEVH